MKSIGPVIRASADLSILYAERLLNGVAAAQFGRLASPGGVVVKSNHPAFIFGHLSLYPARVLSHLRLDPGPHAAPAAYEALFKNGVECRDDPGGTIYPPMNELTARFFAGYRAAADAVGQADDERLLAPNPAEGRMRELFPTIGAAVNFYLGGHVQNHLGQMSAWRRATGLPAA